MSGAEDKGATAHGVFVDTDGIYAPIVPTNAPVILTFSGVYVFTKPKANWMKGGAKPEPKTLLNNCDGTLTGGLWGIMGASGSGKTTLLSVLSMRLDTQHMRTIGEVRINGKAYTKALLKSMSGYVMQDDLLHAHLTVFETLMYTAALRLPRGTTKAERIDRVEEAMKTMGIDYTRDVIIGDSRNKGISGGERKRVCVGQELLTRPKLLFLDEPTSGLDSTTALHLMSTLKDISERGECTIVCTIHQPQTKIYYLIDNLILMKKGEIVYQGACQKADQYFGSMGYPCPDKMNPADHILDVVTIGAHDEKEGAEVSYLSVPIDLDFGLDKDDFTPRAFQPWVWQFMILCHRQMVEKYRRWDIFATNILVTCIVAVFIGCGAWYQVGNAQNSITPNNKFNAILFFTVIHQGVVSSLQGTHGFPLDRNIMLRERQAGSYYVSAYFLSKTGIDSAAQLVAPFVFTAFVHPLVGLDNTISKVGIFLGFQMLLCNCAVALSNMCSCICVSIEMSTVVLACCMEITRLYSAFFVSPLQLDAAPMWKFFDQVSYMKYGYIGLVVNEYTGKKFVCGGLTCPPTAVLKGETIMLRFGYERYTTEYCGGMMIVYILVCRIASYLALRFIKM